MSIEQEVINLLEKLISYDTTNPPGNERQLGLFLKEYLTSANFECEYYGLNENRGSLIARKTFSETGPKLVFNGHLDVVPAIADEWSSDPFNAVIKNGLIYGRGTADMKAGVAAMIVAALKAIALKDLSGKLELHFVADEEKQNLGTKSLQPYWQDADYVVIGEPTELKINTSHRGTSRFNLYFLGETSHSSAPDQGDNAITKAAMAVEVINQINASFNTDDHPILPQRTIAPTQIRGGKSENTIPDRCILTIDRRLFPGETKASIEDEICSNLAKADLIESRDFVYDNYFFLAAGETDPDTPIVKFASNAYQETFGKEAEVTYFSASCEESLFTDQNIQTIIFGPGSLKEAHKVDEFIRISEFEPAVNFYFNFIKQVLGTQ
ncbi:MAG: M20 family metallopeptidase [Clostridiaceae bacterium]|nr:M20 family metallopeptidase [Clostridiaceae bacterium]